MAAREVLKRTDKYVASKKERLNVIARFWSKPTPYKILITDKGHKSGVLITCESKEIAPWWINTFKTAYPQDIGAESGSVVKFRPEAGVSLKINKKDGSLLVGGRNHWKWFAENFETILDNGLQEDVVDGHTGQYKYSELMEVIDRQLDMGDDMEMVMLIKDLPRAGAIRNGPKYIYLFWKALLHRWMTQSAEITIASSKIDGKRLAEIYLLAIRNHLASFTIKLVTQKICDGRWYFKKVQGEAIEIIQKVKDKNGKKGFITNEKIKWALDTVNVLFTSFNCNFISGGVSEERNEILVTSAAFHHDNFEINKRDTVYYSRMTARGLSEFYLQPIGVHSQTVPQPGPHLSAPSVDYGTIGKAKYASNASVASFDPNTFDSHQISFDTEWSGSTHDSGEDEIDKKLEAKRLANEIDEQIEVKTFSAELEMRLENSRKGSYSSFKGARRTDSMSSFKKAQSLGSLDSL